MGRLQSRTAAEIILDAVKRNFTPPRITDDDHDTHIARALYFVLISVVITLGVAFVSVLFFGQQPLFSGLIILPALLMYGLANCEMRRGRVRRASLIFLSFYWVATAAFVLVSGGLTAVSGSLFVTALVISGLFLGWRASIIVLAITLLYTLTIVLFILAGYALPQLFVLNPVRNWIVFVYSIVLSLIPVISLQQGQLQALKYARQQLTEREKAEAALRESEERYRAISELISDYAFAFDIQPDGSMVQAWITDDSFTRLTGYVWADLGLTFALYHPDDVDRARADVAQVITGLQGNEDSAQEYRIVTTDGRMRWVLMRRRPVWDAAHNRVIRYYAAAQDITDQKQSEKIRLELAVERERRNTYRTLMSGVSHDIKTPLAIINTNLYALEKHPDPDVRQKNLMVVKQQTRRLQDFIEDLLAMSKLDAELDLRFSAVDLPELLEGVARELTPIFEQKHLQFSRSVEAGVPLIQADESLLRRAIVNIIVNAANYTPEAGSIAARIWLQANRAVVEVTDTGIGIPSEDLPYIFDPFFRGSSAQSISRSGSGLGLAIVQHVVGHHGGSVEAKSAPGSGSTFRLLLPILR